MRGFLAPIDKATLFFFWNQGWHPEIRWPSRKTAEKTADPNTLPETTTLVLRSPEAVLHHLGRLMRIENRSQQPKVPRICVRGRFQPLFATYPAERCHGTQVAADTGEEVFAIPARDPERTDSDNCANGEVVLSDASSNCESGRSMQALSLLNQLMGLQKSAKELPSTALVRVID